MPQAAQLTPETQSGPGGEQGETQTHYFPSRDVGYNTQQRQNLLQKSSCPVCNKEGTELFGRCWEIFWPLQGTSRVNRAGTSGNSGFFEWCCRRGLACMPGSTSQLLPLSSSERKEALDRELGPAPVPGHCSCCSWAHTLCGHHILRNNP